MPNLSKSHIGTAGIYISNCKLKKGDAETNQNVTQIIVNRGPGRRVGLYNTYAVKLDAQMCRRNFAKNTPQWEAGQDES